MSAKSAAAALLKNDTELAAFAATLRPGWQAGKREAVNAYLRENVMNTWTLTLAADAAGCTEEQAIAALLYMEPLRMGTTCVCRGEAALLFQAG